MLNPVLKVSGSLLGDRDILGRQLHFDSPSWQASTIVRHPSSRCPATKPNTCAHPSLPTGGKQ